MKVFSAKRIAKRLEVLGEEDYKEDQKDKDLENHAPIPANNIIELCYGLVPLLDFI